jgi:nucleotide-binding universal stress UspA family protein
MEWFKNRRVVVPCDFSEESVSAVEVALQLAESPTEVHVVHVLPLLHAAEPAYVWETIDEEKRKEYARKNLEELLVEPMKRGVIVDVRIGDPGHEIVEFATEIAAGLIVIPSHGRTGVRRLLMGSVAERVSRLSHCPVLVLKK